MTMTTDITELAQRMKAAAEKASYGDWVKESGDGWEACCSANDQANGGFIIAHFEGPDAAENREFVQAANPANVLSLVEALEKAQQRIAELESRTVTAAAADVLAERQRQVTAEGWTPEHDDEHSDGEMALAASSYALYAHKKPIAPAIPYNWPWEPEWFKQQGARRDLVKAGALILAEIERIDRAAGIKVEAE